MWLLWRDTQASRQIHAPAVEMVGLTSPLLATWAIPFPHRDICTLQIPQGRPERLPVNDLRSAGDLWPLAPTPSGNSYTSWSGDTTIASVKSLGQRCRIWRRFRAMFVGSPSLNSTSRVCIPIGRHRKKLESTTGQPRRRYCSRGRFENMSWRFGVTFGTEGLHLPYVRATDRCCWSSVIVYVRIRCKPWPARKPGGSRVTFCSSESAELNPRSLMKVFALICGIGS